MKTKIIAILGGICFATLFYDQRFGLNCLLYSVFLILLLYKRLSLLEVKSTFVASAMGMLATAAAMIFHGSNMTIYFYIFSSLLFIGFAAQSQVSTYIAFFNGVYTTIFGRFHYVVYGLSKPKNEESTTYDFQQITRLIFIPLALVLIFIVLYYQINPVFNQWLGKIDLSFIDFIWMVMVILGSWITANVSSSKTVEEVTIKDLNTSNELTIPQEASMDKIKVKNEMQTGVYSMIALNLLLVVLLSSELIYIFQINDFRASVLSAALHSGVYASIGSIVLAIILIVVFFRGDINFVEGNSKLKKLAFAWIFLNFLLTLSVGVKTFIYIDQYGLSIKRIGVLMYLTLCIIGLTTTFLKIDRRFNLTYLFRRNVTIGFSCLLVFSLMNWSAIISSYNIKNNYIDMRQLSELLPQNAPVLKEADMLDEVIKFQTKNYMKDVDLELFANRNWQEFNLIADKIGDK